MISLLTRAGRCMRTEHASPMKLPDLGKFHSGSTVHASTVPGSQHSQEFRAGVRVQGRPRLWSRRWGCDHHLVPQGSTLLHKHPPPSARAARGLRSSLDPCSEQPRPGLPPVHFPPWHQAPVLTRCQGQPADGKVGSPCKQLLLHQVPDHPLNQHLGTFLAFLNSSTTPHLC